MNMQIETTADGKPVFEVHGVKYVMVLGDPGCKPCSLCDVHKECMEDKCDDYLMMCECAFTCDPWYIKKYDNYLKDIANGKSA